MARDAHTCLANNHVERVITRMSIIDAARIFFPESALMHNNSLENPLKPTALS